MSAERPTIDVTPAEGGWPAPWPSVAELADALPPESWTLVGGLMTQLHTIHHGLGIVRATNDVDIVLHIETKRGMPNKVAAALGYQLQPSIDPRTNTAHWFVRETTTVDLVDDPTGLHECPPTSGQAGATPPDRDPLDHLDMQFGVEGKAGAARVGRTACSRGRSAPFQHQCHRQGRLPHPRHFRATKLYGDGSAP